MKIFYNESNKSWWHNQAGLEFTFGVNKIMIPYQNSKPTSEMISLELEPSHNHEIIAIGILTTQNSKNGIGISGNLSLFRSLQMYLLEQRILSYVLTIEDLLNQENCGYIYSNKHQKWQKVSVPLPHIVYNRIPLRSIESSLPFQQLKETFISQQNHHV